jgi:5-methyltetrahydropteroyltriglutamate--homocysteine methyltransferase
MRLILMNNSSYPRVGDRPQEQKLRRALSKYEEGNLTDRQLHDAENWTVSEVIREQVAAGMEVVTDGLVRRHDPISDQVATLENVRIGGLRRYFDTNFLYREPVVEGEPRWVKSTLGEDVAFSRDNSTRPVKAVITGPYTLARMSRVNDEGLKDNIGDLTMAYAAAFASEVEAMAENGAKIIQIDEPMILKHPGDVGILRDAMNVLAEKKGSSQLSLTTFFGDAAKLYGDFQDMPVEILGFDFTYSEDLVGNIEMVGSSKVLALGLLDGRNTKMEDQEDVFRMFDRILTRVSVDHCYLTPSCGLEFLPRDRARRKLELMTTLRFRYARAGGR